MSSFLADIIASAGGEVKNAGREQIEYININTLHEDDRNFYSMDKSSIADLAASIELAGLQQPIRVRDIEGRDVPCIVETDTVSAAMQELRLILANSATRKLSDSDIAKQAERTTELLYQLKEEGVEFPGSMRKHVAEACRISETKLATLKVINENLHEHFKAQFSAGKLPTNTAYNIARLPELVQNDLAKAMPLRMPSGAASESILKNYEKYYDISRLCPDGTQICDNAKGMLSKTAHATMSWDYCDGKCCISCSNGMSCSYACSKAKVKQKETKAAIEKQKEKEEQNRQAKLEENKRATIESAKRLLAFADAAGVSDEEPSGVGYAYSGITFGTLRQWVEDDGGDKTFWDNAAEFSDVENMVKTAKLLGVSTDVLLGLAEPGESSAAPVACEWQTGTPCIEGLYSVKIDIGEKRPVIRIMKWAAMNWRFAQSGGIIDVGVVGWYKIPEV